MSFDTYDQSNGDWDSLEWALNNAEFILLILKTQWPLRDAAQLERVANLMIERPGSHHPPMTKDAFEQKIRENNQLPEIPLRQSSCPPMSA